MLDRRRFTPALPRALSPALRSAAARRRRSRSLPAGPAGYGPLVPDPAGLLDLPRGFSYRIISKLGDRMDDGHFVPDRADGMGAFRLDGRRDGAGPQPRAFRPNGKDGPFRASAPAGVPAFDHGADGQPLPGGTTTIVYDYRSGRVESQYLSLVGTIRNCAGGTTPWGSWLTCEEDVSKAGSGGLKRDHGWVFEVPAAGRGIAAPVPLTAMGRFNHEAAAVDPRTGIVYLTEDRDDSLFYRFLPASRGQLARGGRLQALAFRDRALGADSRNWSGETFPLQSWRAGRLGRHRRRRKPRRRSAQARPCAGRGAVRARRGHPVAATASSISAAPTAARPSSARSCATARRASKGRPASDREPGQLQLFVESTSTAMLNFGDNIVVAPTGHLIVCEDQYGATSSTTICAASRPTGTVYTLAPACASRPSSPAPASRPTDGPCSSTSTTRRGRSRSPARGALSARPLEGAPRALGLVLAAKRRLAGVG